MAALIYIEEDVRDHPRTQAICARNPQATIVECSRYGEVFNRRAQNFRLQKSNPSVILARKHDGWVLPAPSGYGVGSTNNHYFSHMLNCVYDCRYCFLQGMYQSAHHVVFVNYEDFQRNIGSVAGEGGDAHNPPWFFSGYDCDSLALEPLTHFAREFVDFFRELPDAWLELRTKSTQTRFLLESAPLPNVVVAYSFTPQEFSESLEIGVPSVDRRLTAMVKLAQHGWKLGLRFDPLLYDEGFRDLYARHFASVFKALPQDAIHSVSLGAFRLPCGFFRKLERLYPDEALLAGPLEDVDGMVSYEERLGQDLLEFCRAEIQKYVPPDRLFECQTDEPAQEA